MILRVMSSRTIRAATRMALATPLSLALPWLFTTRPLRPRKTAPLWLFGIEMVASSSVAGREIRKPIFDRIELVKARRRRSVTKRAVPSTVFSAMLPGKAVGDDDVGAAARDLVALDEAVEAHAEIGRLREGSRPPP